MEFIFDLGYKPTNELYHGVQAKSSDGRWNIPMSQETVNSIKGNARKLASKTNARVAVITGGAPVWAYAAAAAAIANLFEKVVTRDANGNELTIASKI